MKFTRGDKVICIKECECDGGSRNILKGEEVEISGISTDKKKIWFTITACGGGNYKPANFMLLGECLESPFLELYEIY